MVKMVKRKWLKLVVTLDLIFGTCTCMLQFLPISVVKHCYMLYRFCSTWVYVSECQCVYFTNYDRQQMRW